MLLLLLLLLFFPIVIIFVFLFLVHADKFQTILAISRLGPCTMAPCPPPLSMFALLALLAQSLALPSTLSEGTVERRFFLMLWVGGPKHFGLDIIAWGCWHGLFLIDLKKIVLLTKSCRGICSRLMLELLEIYTDEELFIFEGRITQWDLGHPCVKLSRGQHGW